MKQMDRDALILDRAIDLLLAGNDVPARPLMAEVEGLLRAVESLPPSGAVDAARQRMFAEPVGGARHTRRMRWLVAIPAAAVLCVGGVAFAARNAVSGDALYRLHRAEEASRIAFAFGAEDRAGAKLDRAAGDLSEARVLLAAGRRGDSRDAVKTFWSDLADARAAIAGVPALERGGLEARADALASDGSTFADLLAAPAAGSVDPRGGAGDAGDVRRGPGSGSSEESGVSGGETRSGESETSGSGSQVSGSDSGSSGSGTTDSGSSTIEETPTPTPSASSSGDASHDGGSSGDVSASPTPALLTSSSDDHAG